MASLRTHLKLSTSISSLGGSLSNSLLVFLIALPFFLNKFFIMALNQPQLNLAESEQRVLHAGRIPYESFKVRAFSPFRLQPPPSSLLLG